MALYTPVAKTNLSSQIAENLENLIINQELKVGDKLPGEIELAEKFGTSRNILREAMTTLKERGLIEVRNGSGAYVAKPDANMLGDVVNRLVTIGSVEVRDVYELRMAIEVYLSSVAAKNATEEDIASLDDIIGKMEKEYNDNEKWAQQDYEFHEALAIFTHNVLFPEFLRPLLRMVYNLSGEKPRTVDRRLSGIEQHKKIVEAIKAHDSRAAERTMAEHLNIFLSDLIE